MKNVRLLLAVAAMILAVPAYNALSANLGEVIDTFSEKSADTVGN